MMSKKLLLRAIQSAVVASAVVPLAAQAVPSFARQTGLTCAACHTVFPQLTPFGRMFKLNGYTMEGSTSHQTKRLEEDYIPPLSAMMQVSYTSQKANDVPGTSTKDTADFPQQFSFFYAGRISDHIGTIMQITYDGSTGGGTFGADNTDIRYSNKNADGSVVYGWSLNNAPTVQDLYNSTPVWGFPADHSPETQDPTVLATVLGGDAMNQNSLGLTAYAMWNGHIYGELGAYHTAHVGGGVNGNTNMDGWAPYYRLAYETDFGKSNLEVGLLGMNSKWYATGTDYMTQSVSSGTTGKADDLGVDGQYQYLDGPTTFTGRLYYMTEKDTGADGASHKFHTLDASGTYYWNRMYGGSLMYHAASGDNYYNGGQSPDDASWTLQANYLPWLNTKFAIAYTTYTKVPGGVTNKSDYNTLYLLGWFMY